MSGPPPIPFMLKKLRGNPGHQKLRAPPEPASAPNCPEPPPFLSSYAQDEWWRTSPQLHVLGLLSTVDVACLAAYCQSYALWREASEALARMAAHDEHTHALLIKTVDGNPRRNPLIKVARDAAADMVRFAGEFGLTPVARSRLAAGIHAQPSAGKFDGLLGGGPRPEPGSK
jgi:P27 family predicted phage terminase small subunit